MATTERRSEAIWIDKKNYWQVKVQKDGERKGFTSSVPGRRGKHEAEGKADEWLEKGTSEVRLQQAWDTFLAYQKDHSGTANYMQNESLGRLWVLTNIKGNTKLSKITPIMWQKCIDAPANKGLSRRTCKNVRTVVSAFLSYARRERWNYEPLIKGDIVIPKSAPVGKRNILQPAALKKLFTIDYITKWRKETPSFFIHAWRFLVLTGLRRGELCGLRRDELNGRVLQIQRSFNAQNEETRGKNDNAPRTFIVPKVAMGVLEAQRKMLIQRGIVSPWLFPDEHGERLNSNHLYSMWDTYRNQHELNCSLHELRHTLISMAKIDMPEPLLKALVGHSDDMDTFGVYGHEVTGEMERTADILDSIFERILPPEAFAK